MSLADFTFDFCPDLSSCSCQHDCAGVPAERNFCSTQWASFPAFLLSMEGKNAFIIEQQEACIVCFPTPSPF